MSTPNPATSPSASIAAPSASAPPVAPPAAPSVARPANPPAALPPLAGNARLLGTLALSLATFMNVLDSSIANVSIPSIAGNLGVSPGQGTWSSPVLAWPMPSRCRSPAG